METTKLSKELSIASQITADDIPLIHAMGYKSLICNRPDGEAIDQQLFETIEKVAGNLGMVSRYMPIRDDTDEQPDEAVLRDAISQLPKPILAYCETGKRSREVFEPLVDKVE